MLPLGLGMALQVHSITTFYVHADGVEYQGIAEELTFTGNGTQCRSVIINDNTVEEMKSFTVNLNLTSSSEAISVVGLPATATVIILSDDGK